MRPVSLTPTDEFTQPYDSGWSGLGPGAGRGGFRITAPRPSARARTTEAQEAWGRRLARERTANRRKQIGKSPSFFPFRYSRFTIHSFEAPAPASSPPA